MKFTKFAIKNFKGIDSIEINLDKSPEANIYTLVGLNESGKTTILEAINFFNERNKNLSLIELPESIITDSTYAVKTAFMGYGTYSITQFVC